MKIFRICLLTLICGVIQLCTGLPLTGIAVGFTASFGPAPAMFTGALAGAVFSGLPMGLRFISASVLSVSGLIAGQFRPSGLALYLVCSAIMLAETLCGAAVSVLVTGEISPATGERAGIYIIISLLIAALIQPVLRRLSGEKYA